MQVDYNKSSQIKAKDEIAQKETEKVSLINDLQNQLVQKQKEHASLLGSHTKIVQSRKKLRSQLKQKQIEARKQENEHASSVRDLQEKLARAEKECSKKADEHASLVRDLEKLRAHNDELAQRIRILSQRQVIGATWQFQGDSREWFSFPAPLHMFGRLYFLSFPRMWCRWARGLSAFSFLCT